MVRPVYSGTSSAVGEGLSVIVPVRNSELTLARLLLSIDLPDGISHEVIVVDNSSTDSTQEIAKAHGALLAVAGPERSSQRNRGASIARNSLLLFLDSDMVVSRQALKAAIERSRISDAVIIPEVGIGASAISLARELERRAYSGNSLYEVARLIRKEVFDEIGGYDPSLTGTEDLDLQAKLEERGYRVLWSDVPILHDETQLSTAGYLRKRRYYSRTDAAYKRKHPDRWSSQKNPLPRIRMILRQVHTLRDFESAVVLLAVRSVEGLTRRVWA